MQHRNEDKRVELDTFNPAMIARPHAFYAELREKMPIVFIPQLDAWVLTRYEDVREVLRDHVQWSSARGDRQTPMRNGVQLESVAPPGTLTMLGADRPDHTRLRKLLAMDFTPNRIGHLAPHVASIANRLLDSAGDEFDVVDTLSVPLPVTMIAELLGIPPELGAQFKRWSDAAIEPMHPDRPADDVRARNAEIVAFREYLQEQIDRRHEEPTDDFIGRLVAAHDEEERLSDDELLGAVNLLLLAGNETTTNLISNAVLALCRFPERQKELVENPDLMDAAIEEFLRYDGSVQFTARTAMSPATFHGQQVEEGQTVAVFIASGNRDPRVFERPDELDFHRPKSKHLGFGDWIHICIGQFLARMETKAALSALLERFAPFELAIEEEEIPYRANFNLRGPLHLPIRRC